MHKLALRYIYIYIVLKPWDLETKFLSSNPSYSFINWKSLINTDLWKNYVTCVLYYIIYVKPLEECLVQCKDSVNAIVTAIIMIVIMTVNGNGDYSGSNDNGDNDIFKTNTFFFFYYNLTLKIFSSQ